MRRAYDFYPTPEFATEILLRHVLIIDSSVFECCAGDGAIADVLESSPDVSRVLRNDINREMPKLHWSQDMADATNWKRADFDWVITNPPFSLASQIVPLAYEHASKGIAMLLRLSYLEPTEDRGAWLNEHPPTTLIVLPRISFTGNGKTDNVTCAWMVWEKSAAEQRIIVAENPRFVKQETEERQLTMGAGIMKDYEWPLP